MLRTVSPAELAERVHAERRGVPFVVYLDGDGRQQLVDLGERTRALSVGRSETNDIAAAVGHRGLARARDARAGRRGVDARRRRLLAQRLVRQRRARPQPPAAGRRRPDRHRPHDARLRGRERSPTRGRPTRRATRSRPSCRPPSAACWRRCAARASASRSPAPASNREIAEELVVSVDTVKSHLHALFELFGVAGHAAEPQAGGAGPPRVRARPRGWMIFHPWGLPRRRREPR